MDHNKPEVMNDPVVGRITEVEHSESVCPEKKQGSPMVANEVTLNGSWSQRSISRTLQRAETLLRNTLNPHLKWLFHGRSHDDNAEEGHFVVTHNLVSRSSARLLHLQQALLTVTPQWQLVGAQMGSPQVCVKGIPADGVVLLPPSSSSLHGHYRNLWRLLEQRSLLLFIHEYTRRAHLTATYISRVRQMLEDQLKNLHQSQIPSSWSTFLVDLVSLSQELRVHLNHSACLFSKVQSDHYLRRALAQQSRLLAEVKQTLDSLGLQALVLMEHFLSVILSVIAQTELDLVPREVLQDILAGTDVYNQAVEEQRLHHRSTQLRNAVLHQAHYSTLHSNLPNSMKHHPAAFSVKELTKLFVVHHAEKAAKQLLCWASALSHQMCHPHNNPEAYSSSVCNSIVNCGTSTPRSECTWEHTYLISSPLFSPNHPQTLSSSHCIFNRIPVYIPDTHLDSAISVNLHPMLSETTAVQHRTGCSNIDITGQLQTSVKDLGCEPKTERQNSFKNCKQQMISLNSNTIHQLAALPLSAVCQQDNSSVELLFQLLVSSSDPLAPLVSHTPEIPTDKSLPNTITDVISQMEKTDPKLVQLKRQNTALKTKDQIMEGTPPETRNRLESTGSSGGETSDDPEKEETLEVEDTAEEADCFGWPHSVQGLDLGHSLVFADLMGQYRAQLWTLCSKALWLQMHSPQAGNAAESINLQGNHRGFHILHQISQASEKDLVPKECIAMLEDFSLNLSALTAHAQWDYVLCRTLGSALKDKCLIDANQGSNSVTLSFNQVGRGIMSVTMQNFLLLCRPLLSLCSHHPNRRALDSFSLFPSSLALQGKTVNLALATVQLSTVWVMSKAYQFLSSWSLNKFLLIVQGDLYVLRESLEMLLHQTKAVMMNADHHSDFHNHNQLLMRQQLQVLDNAVSELQTFSSLVLKSFSSDCKRISGEIFQLTMPSSKHWRPSRRTGFPSSPSEYASLAIQTVIGPVLEGVAPLSDDASVQALSVTMTAFLEAWMEHILKQKIKFSVQGALQLKQDFESIRELIRSDKYGLSAELHQRLLSLRVFQQVDAAVVCLLQQPQSKSYLQCRTWEPFTHCCLVNSSRDSIDRAVGSSITNLRCMEGEDVMQSDPSFVTTELPPENPSTNSEPYLAPSFALGSTQQEWLDLRIHSNARRWRLPGLQCLFQSEP